MNLHNMVVRAGKFTADNSPTIMTAIGVTGTLTTAYLTGKASFKAAELLRDDMRVRVINGDLGLPDTKDKVAVVWKLYLPAIGAGVVTVTCIIAANRVGVRRTAAMAAAYSISEKAWGEYKEKIVEKLGQNKEQAARDELAQERVDRNPVTTREVIITGTGDVLCYDSITGRYFQSNVETLRKAENDINKQILDNMYASLYDFYDLVGLPPTPYSQEVGWNSDRLLELGFSTVLSEDKRPCISIDYALFPIRDYARLQ